MSLAKKCKSKSGCICHKGVQERFQAFMPKLQELSRVPPKERVNILRSAPPCLIKLLCESGLNILKGNLKLKEDQYKKLKPHKRVLLMISKPSISLKQRREALGRKKGGFLPVVIPILLSALSTLAGQAVARAVGL